MTLTSRYGVDRGALRSGGDEVVEVQVVGVVAARVQRQRRRLELRDDEGEVESRADAQRVDGAGGERRGGDRRHLAAVVDGEPHGLRPVERDPHGGEPWFPPPYGPA